MEEHGGSIIQNNLSKYGLRTLHILQDGQAPNYEDYLSKVPEAAWPSLSVLKVKDRELSNLWHLWIWWHAHEVVQLIYGETTLAGVLWTIEKGQRASDAIKDAALEHAILLDDWPDIVWMSSIPEGAADVLEWQSDLVIEPVRVKLVEMPGLPKGCLFVYREKLAPKSGAQEVPCQPI